MVVRTFKYVNRLAKALGRRSGLTLQEAVTAADERLEVLRERSLREVDRTILDIAALAQAAKSLDDPRVQQIYVAANRIVAIAGVFEKDELGEAAYSLCELISRFRAVERWSSDMVAVHVDALQAMRAAQSHTAAHRAALREGLQRVVAGVV